MVYRETQTVDNIFGEGADARVTVEASPGDISVTGRLDGEISLGVQQGIGIGVLGGIQNVTGFQFEGLGDTVGIRYGIDTSQFVPEAGGALRENFNQVRDQVPDFGALRQIAGLPGAGLATSANDVITSIERNINNISGDQVPLRAVGPGIGIVGSTPQGFGESVEFPAPAVPVAEDSDLLNRLPPIPLTVTIYPVDAIQNVVSGSETLVFRIPPDEIINTINVSDLACGEIAPNMEEAISELRSRTNQLRGEVNNSLDTLQDARSELTSAAGVGSLRGIGDRQLAGIRQSTVDDVRDRLQQVQIPDRDLSNIRSNLENLRDRIEDLTPDCQGEFGSILDEIENRLESIQSNISELENINNRIEDIIGRVGTIDCGEAFSQIEDSISEIEDNVGFSPSINQFNLNEVESLLGDIQVQQNTIRGRIPSGSPCRDRFMSRLDSLQGDLQRLESRLEGREIEVPEAPEIPELGCGDVSRSIRNGVNGLEDSVSNFSNRDRSRRTQSTRNRLIQTANDLEEQIQNTVNDQNPCKSQLLSRVRSSRQRIQGIQLRRPDLVPCSEQFPNLENQIDSLEDQIIGVAGALTQGEIDDILENAESISNQIQNNVPANNRCRGRLSGRVQSALDQLERQTRSARVRIAIPEEQRQQARQQARQLRDRLERVVGRARPG